MSVCVQIDDKTAIISDRYQWSIAKPRTMDDGSPGWSGYLHYKSFEAACQGWVELQVRQSTATSVQELRQVRHGAEQVIQRIGAVGHAS